MKLLLIALALSGSIYSGAHAQNFAPSPNQPIPGPNNPGPSGYPEPAPVNAGPNSYNWECQGKETSNGAGTLLSYGQINEVYSTTSSSSSSEILKTADADLSISNTHFEVIAVIKNAAGKIIATSSAPTNGNFIILTATLPSGRSVTVDCTNMTLIPD
jgi:hypothetical protein